MDARGPALVADDYYPRYRWVIIAQLLLAHLMMPLLFSSLGVLLPSMQEELAFGTIQAGWLGAARTAGQLLVFPASIILVRFAPNRLFGLSIVLLACALFLAGLAPSFFLVLAGIVLYSVTIAFGQIPANLVRLQWIPPQEFATVAGVGLALSTIAQSAGLAFIPLVLDALGGWRSVFLGNGLLLLAVAGIWALTARERITARYQTAQAQERGLVAARSTLRRQEFYLLGLAVLGGATAFTTSLLFLPSYFVHERGFSLATAGSITAVVPLGGLAVNLTAGYFSDRMGRRKPLIWPSGIFLPPLYLLMLSPLPPAALIVVALALGWFVFMPFPALQTIPFELPGLRPAEVAMGQSLMQTIATVGILSGPVIASTVTDLTGSYRLGIMSLCFLPTLFVFVCLALPETGAATKRKALA